jgi:hypothetical protein
MPHDRLPRRPPPRALHYVPQAADGTLLAIPHPVRGRRGGALHGTTVPALVTCPRCRALLPDVPVLGGASDV